MAIVKKSNQITFTEQKKIKELREWYLATDLSEGVTRNTEGWTTNTQSVNSDDRYLWNYEEVIYSLGDPDVSDPVLIGMYGTGADGKGITDILNYYSTTQEPELPEEIPNDFWKDNLAAIKELSSINKYLWNYEKILYTDGSDGSSEPMIIGVYGDSGEDAITFQIYSPDGFEFKDGIDEEEQLKTIELHIAAFKGSEPLTDATFTWSYWNTTLNDGVGGYVDIENYINVSEKSFSVNDTDSYALANLKCTMLYNEQTYEDYVTLNTKLDIYSASIKFLNGTNVFSQTQEYLIGYIDLYKNNKLEESVSTFKYHVGAFSIDQNTNVITTDYTIKEANNEMIYFIYLNNDTYNIVLGRYNGKEWYVIDEPTKYIYQNSVNFNTTLNLFVIHKRNIVKTENVDVSVYTKYTNITQENGQETKAIDLSSIIATTHVTVTDLNDVISSPIEPENAYEGQLWLDTDNNILKIRSDDKWVNAAKQKKGQDTYTIKPEFYEVGDLWIVAQEDAFDKFTEGSIWTAIRNSSDEGEFKTHWSDAVPKITELKNNVDYYMDFTQETGLRIGEKGQRFYVNVDATRMSFCEDTGVGVPDEEIARESDPNEVVHIGNKSATIRNIIVEDSADINCAASIDTKINIVNTYNNTKEKYPGFTWQVEADGSFSLVHMGEVN